MPPRFGGPGRGPGPGGPMPGSFGFNRPFPHFDYNIPSSPRQQPIPGGTNVVATLSYMQTGAAETFRQAFRKQGKIRGTITGLRVLVSGGLRNQVFEGRMNTIDMLLKENRITKQQANARKMDAAKRYNRYLLKVGYITQEEYIYGMQKFGEKLGVQYVYDGPQGGRTR